jgi:hypothetical protein
MKTKMYVLAALLMASMVNVMAGDWISILYPTPTDAGTDADDRTKDFPLGGYSDWSNGCYISKDFFSDAVPGNEIFINGWIPEGDRDKTHKIYVGGDTPGYHFPGTDFRVSSLPVSCYLTQEMIDAIKGGQNIRIYGENMTINRVELYTGKAGSVKFGKVLWMQVPTIPHPFIMDSWTTLDLYKEALAGVDFSKYKAIRFYHDANRTDFVMNIIQAWDPEVKIADQNDMTKTNEYFELPLDETMRGKFTTFMSSGEGTLKIQCNKESGEAFHLTDVVLLPISPDDCSNCFYVY